MIKKVLIADHGDVAVQFISKFKRAGIKTVAVYVVQDVNSEQVRLADEAICIGDTQSDYGNWHRIILAAEISEVAAIHPGNNPLSTHERFVEVCSEMGIRLIRRNAEQGGSA